MTGPARLEIDPGSWLERAAVSAVVRSVRGLPPRAWRGLASLVAAVAWRLGVRRAVALDNLARAFPELDAEQRRRIARGAYETMARAAVDALTSDLLSPAELHQRVRWTDRRGMDTLLAAGRPVLVATAHLGSWELLGEVLARTGFPVTAVVRPLRGALNAWIVEARRRSGLELILQRGALTRMVEAVRRGRMVVQLVDQALPSRAAVWVPFFGRPAATSPALAAVALRTGAPVYVGVAAREGEQLVITLDGPVPPPVDGSAHERVEALTAEITRRLEGLIRRWPDQWLWLHRRWKGTPVR